MGYYRCTLEVCLNYIWIIYIAYKINILRFYRTAIPLVYNIHYIHYINYIIPIITTDWARGTVYALRLAYAFTGTT